MTPAACQALATSLLTGAGHGAYHDPAQARRTARLLRDRGPAAADRAHSEHLTASCLVVSPDFSSVLLTLHRKAGLWLQFGGHAEAADSSAARTAEREAREESGRPGLELLAEVPVDVGVHELSDSFGHCRVHFDVMYAAVLDPTAPIAASHESTRIQWHPLAALPDLTAPDLPGRIDGIVERTSRLAQYVNQSAERGPGLR